MRLVTSLFAVALAIGAVIAPSTATVIAPGMTVAVSPHSVQAADAAKAVLTFAPAANRSLYS